MSLYLNYHQVFATKINSTIVESFPSDTLPHIEFTKEYFNNQRYIPHPLWHILVKGTASILHFSIEDAAVLVSSLLLLFWALLIYFVTVIFLGNTLQKFSPTHRESILLLITFSIFTIGPLVFPPYSHLIYKGVGSPNIWHNVTLWTVKPFALLTILFTIWGKHKQNSLYYMFAISTAVLSIFAKPSFILVFLPAIILLSIDRRYLSKQHIVFLISLTIVSVSILAYQYLHNYEYSSKGGIIVDFLGVWSANGSTNILLSIILALGFPLIFYVLYPDSSKNDFLLLSWLQVLFGIILYAVFAEKGAHYSHGNFGWSYYIALNMLYLFSIIEFFKVFTQLTTWKQVLLSLILILQIFIGIYYLIHILLGQNPLYIGIFI